MSIKSFGSYPSIGEVHQITLRAGQLEASILTWGATLQALQLAGEHMTLGLSTLAQYVEHSPNFGSTIGRSCNRIGNGHISIDGEQFQLDCNEGNKHHLHGGTQGFAKRLWTVEEVSADAVTLSLQSLAGDQGYPGTVDVQCQYRLTREDRLQMEFTARTTQPTIVNLCHHSYFNLDGSTDISRHKLQIPARCYLPVDEDKIPTGEIRDVAGTAFDFRSLRSLADADVPPLDHNFCLRTQRLVKPELSAVLLSEASGVKMETWSTEPGLQVYDASAMNVAPKGHGGRSYGPRAGLCLEPQAWPDSPNHKDFIDTLLRPNAEYRQLTEYRFN
ncbi:aldose epimerase family protein [Polycladidibacter hongkongensis]|uniref:aldose epimerase family protein n=1 Tax=Polycladidibacter hongkongensis TaxID=1647556 RepID=UPI00082FF034|nr:aldose epimerase family protein [Pseudovibrio hongkongensis]